MQQPVLVRFQVKRLSFRVHRYVSPLDDSLLIFRVNSIIRIETFWSSHFLFSMTAFGTCNEAMGEPRRLGLRLCVYT